MSFSRANDRTASTSFEDSGLSTDIDIGRYRHESTPIKRVPVSENNQSDIRIKIKNIFQSRSSAREQLHKKSNELAAWRARHEETIKSKEENLQSRQQQIEVI